MINFKNLLICGGGMMGKGIAQIFSVKKDLEINVYDKFDIDIHEGIRKNMSLLKEKGIITDKEIEERLSRINFIQDINSNKVKEADIVIECVIEVMETKQDLCIMVMK